MAKKQKSVRHSKMDRKFDGKIYHQEDIYPTKAKAQGMGRMLRADGYSVRVVKYSRTGKRQFPYAVYKRRVRSF